MDERYFPFLILDLGIGLIFFGFCWVLRYGYRSKSQWGPFPALLLLWGGLICNILIAAKVLDVLGITDSDERLHGIWIWLVPMLSGLILGMFIFNPRKKLETGKNQKLACPKCGQAIKVGARFCGSCDYKFI